MVAVRKRNTLEDVARMAGASPGVVSSVLNGNRHKATCVSIETQERIRRAAVALDYRPNLLACSLQRRQTRNLLFASCFISSSVKSCDGGFFVKVLDTALMAATRQDYDLSIHLVEPREGQARNSRHLETLPCQWFLAATSERCRSNQNETTVSKNTDSRKLSV